MKESQLVQKIRDWLTKQGCLAFKYHGSVYGYKGHSDIYGIFPCGRAYFIEVKLPNQKPESWQKSFLNLVSAYNAVAGWCDSLEGAKRLIKPHLNCKK